MKKVLALAAVAEAATGAALLVAPLFVVRLLLGAEPVGLAMPVARVAGVAVVALSFACWPGPPLLGILIYSSLVTLYFLYLGIGGEWVGPVLWPALALHAVLTLLLARSWLAKRTTDRAQKQNP
jgi:hypothetical protein